MWTLLLAFTAWGDDGVVLPWAAPWAVQVQYAQWRTSREQVPAELQCRPLWANEVRLCRRELTEGRLRRLHVGDSTAGLVSTTDASAWIQAETEVVSIPGMDTSYRLLRDSQGRAAWAAEYPEVLAKDLGVPFLAAMPDSQRLLAWSAGEPLVDRVMAVGVHEMFAASSTPVSDVVFAWDGERWFAFASANPVVTEQKKGGPSEEDPPSGADGARTHDL